MAHPARAPRAPHGRRDDRRAAPRSTPPPATPASTRTTCSAGSQTPRSRPTLRDDIRAARRPSSASLAQVHKLASTDDGGSRYTCPSFEITGPTAAASTSPASSPSRSTRPRSPTSPRSSRAARRPSRSSRCSSGPRCRWPPSRSPRSWASSPPTPAPSWPASRARRRSGPDGYWSLPAAAGQRRRLAPAAEPANSRKRAHSARPNAVQRGRFARVCLAQGGLVFDVAVAPRARRSRGRRSPTSPRGGTARPRSPSPIR